MLEKWELSGTVHEQVRQPLTKTSLHCSVIERIHKNKEKTASTGKRYKADLSWKESLNFWKKKKITNYECSNSLYWSTCLTYPYFCSKKLLSSFDIQSLWQWKRQFKIPANGCPGCSLWSGFSWNNEEQLQNIENCWQLCNPWVLVCATFQWIFLKSFGNSTSQTAKNNIGLDLGIISLKESFKWQWRID